MMWRESMLLSRRGKKGVRKGKRRRRKKWINLSLITQKIIKWGWFFQWQSFLIKSWFHFTAKYYSPYKVYPRISAHRKKLCGMSGRNLSSQLVDHDPAGPESFRKKYIFSYIEITTVYSVHVTNGHLGWEIPEDLI